MEGNTWLCACRKTTNELLKSARITFCQTLEPSQSGKFGEERSSYFMAEECCSILNCLPINYIKYTQRAKGNHEHGTKGSRPTMFEEIENINEEIIKRSHTELLEL